MKFSIIHPSRSRPQRAEETIHRWISAADKPVEYILSVDNDDPCLDDYINVAGRTGVTLVLSDNRSAIDAVNKGAEVSSGDIMIQIAEDFICPSNWDTLLLNELHDKSDFIVKTNDGIQAWIITLPILDKVYYNRFGYIYPPHIKHLFSDTWITHVADLLGRKIKLNITFEHHHPFTGKNKRDAINVKNDLTFHEGAAQYIEGVKNNFGLKLEEIVGELEADLSIRNWLLKNGVGI